jgi:hypothetical protein
MRDNKNTPKGGLLLGSYPLGVVENVRVDEKRGKVCLGILRSLRM